jgi:glycosyltransferase involved in cell wall biosynthesis
MKLAVVTSYPRDPLAPRGGVESVSVNLVRGLARRSGLEIDVVTTEADRTAVEVEEAEGFRVHRLPRGKGPLLREAVGPGRHRVQAYLRDLRPDVVHAHDVYGLMVKGFEAPRVFTVHGFIHADTRVSGQRFPLLRALLWEFFEVAGWRDQPHVISISPYVRERLTNRVGGRIHDIDNPVAEDFFEIESRPREARIFSAALVEPRLAGSVGDAAYARRVEEHIAALGLGGRVDLLGPVKSPRVREELAEASVFALVSLEENSPMGIEEAMAAGVPVVTSDRCGMPYMVRDGETGFLVDPGDPREIADRLGELLASDDLRRRFGQRARQVARERYHPDAVAARTAEVYRRAVAGSRR